VVISRKVHHEAVYAYVGSTRYPARDRLIFVLSVRAGLMAKEFAALKWEMITDAEGELNDVIALTNEVREGVGAGGVYLSPRI
jgi:integrase/recombinase XerD